jgi:WD40 repeat protein
VTSVKFSPDGKSIASGSYDGTVRIWDVATGDEMAKLEGHRCHIYSVCYSPDGQTIASGSSDNTACVWDVATGEMKVRFEGYRELIDSRIIIDNSGDHDVRMVCVSPDGKTVASGSYDKTVRIWDIATGDEMAKLGPQRCCLLGLL